MKEKPILFSAPMVRAILAGTKSQTRRVVAPSNSIVNGQPDKSCWPHLLFDHAEARSGSVWSSEDAHLSAPYRHPEDATRAVESCGRYRVRSKFEKGDRLWVRETFGVIPDDGGTFVYRATDPEWETECGLKWKPSIFMPRWASRLTLEVTSVRVERLQDISEEDADAEGVTPLNFYAGRRALNRCYLLTFRKGYSHLWDTINAPRGFGWDANPFVWVVTFRRAEQPPIPTAQATGEGN